MDVQVVFPQQLRPLGEEALHQAQGDPGGLLHHVPKLAGDDHLPLPLGEKGLDVEDLAPHRGPGQAGDHPGAGLRQDLLVLDGPGLHGVPDQVGGHRDGPLRLRGHPDRQGPAEGVDVLPQAPDPRLHGVVGDEGLQGLLPHGQPVRRDAHGLHGLGDQVLPGDGQLLQGGVAPEGDDLHPVQQGGGDGVGGVGGAEEENVGEVVGHVHVVVGEGAVLLRVQDLQQGAGGAAVEGVGQLIHLVQHHHGVGHPALLDAVHDPAGHGPDVGPPVAPDVRLVVDAPQAHPDVLPPQGPGDALADGGLAGARGPHEEEDGPGLLPLQIHDGDLLDHPVLHLVQAVVVLV